MTNEKPVAGYHVLSEAWYGEACPKDANYPDKITIGLFYKDGGCNYEFGIKWIKLGCLSEARLGIYWDAWPLFQEPLFIELFSYLKSLPDNPTVADVKALLDDLGFKDLTERKQ